MDSCPDFGFSARQCSGWLVGAAIGGSLCPMKSWWCRVAFAAAGAAIADRLLSDSK